MMILPVILIAGAVYFIYKEQINNLQLQPCKVVDNSLNILNERFARGEISDDEYVRIRSALNNI